MIPNEEFQAQCRRSDIVVALTARMRQSFDIRMGSRAAVIIIHFSSCGLIVGLLSCVLHSVSSDKKGTLAEICKRSGKSIGKYRIAIRHVRNQGGTHK